MLIYDDIYHWEGWGGALRLGSGQCHLTICDLTKGDSRGLTHLRPIIVVVSDMPESGMTIRSCAGHIATGITRRFDIVPSRMLYVEYYPTKTYGEHNEFKVTERYDAAEFSWHGDKAIRPKWRTLSSSLLDIVKQCTERPPTRIG